MRYCKKPIEIEAVQMTKKARINYREWPVWLRKAVYREMSKPGAVWMGKDGAMYINTLEGDLQVSEDDWIIQGIQGELYPCKPGIFSATYDPVHQV